MRDLTKAQFKNKLAKYGFVSCGFMGYYSLPKPHSHMSICTLNAGDNRRRQLAYLVMEWEKARSIER